MANGGYKSGITEAEFPDREIEEEFRRYLRGEVRNMPSMLSAYYGNGAMGEWLQRGLAVLVNAIAYRSPKLSEEPINKALAKTLPSVQLHRRWVMESVVPDAGLGRRFLVVHRNGMWGLDRSISGPTIIFSKNPTSPYLADEVVVRAKAWLAYRQ